MDPLIFFEIEAIPLLVQLVTGLWAKLAPARRIQDPAKSLTARCCYHSALAASSQAAWDHAQQLYAHWNLRLLLPSAAASLLCVAAFTLLVRPAALTLPVLLVFCCCLAVPFFFLLRVRRRTETDLRQWLDRAEPDKTGETV